jgi:hypothetical protein
MRVPHISRFRDVGLRCQSARDRKEGKDRCTSESAVSSGLCQNQTNSVPFNFHG